MTLPKIKCAHLVETALESSPLLARLIRSRPHRRLTLELERDVGRVIESAGSGAVRGHVAVLIGLIDWSCVLFTVLTVFVSPTPFLHTFS